MDDPSKNPAVVAAINQVTTLEHEVTRTVDTEQQLLAAGGELLLIKGALTRLEEARTGITKPINDSLKKVNELFRGPRERLERLEGFLKRAIAGYHEKCRRAAAEKQAEFNRKAEAERKRLEERAANWEAKGETGKAERLQQQAQAVVAPLVVSAAPKVAGIQTRQVWQFKVIDQSKVPEEYKKVDEVRLGKVVRALGADCSIPGIEVYPETQIAASAS